VAAWSEHQERFPVMGGEGLLHLFGPADRLEDAVEAAIREAWRIEAKYSRYREDSVLAQINRQAALGGQVRVDAETAGLLDLAAAFHAHSAGRFDITSGVLREAWDFESARLPDEAAVQALLSRVGWHRVQWLPASATLHFKRPGMALDLGGLGKEYAVDRLAEVLAAHGIASGLVDLAGDLRILGPRPDDSPWTVGVRHPRQLQAASASVVLRQGAVATSGDYERFMEVDGRRYSHLLDARTGWPCQGLSSVTVQAPTCLLAGGMASIGMLMGPAGPAWLAGLGLDHFWTDAQGRSGGRGPFVAA
jgi:FAD:protein FMN transferase